MVDAGFRVGVVMMSVIGAVLMVGFGVGVRTVVGVGVRVGVVLGAGVGDGVTVGSGVDLRITVDTGFRVGVVTVSVIGHRDFSKHTFGFDNKNRIWFLKTTFGVFTVILSTKGL